MTTSARRPGGRLSYRVVIAATVPFLWVTLPNLGPTGTAARDITGLETARRPTNDPAPNVPVLDVQLAQLPASQPATEPLLFRNPFAFAPRTLSPAPLPSPIPIAAPPEAPPDLPSTAALSLIGIATTSRADGRSERTAIIAGFADALYFVRDGDAVIARYRVDAVLPESVRLVDHATGASLNLILR